MTKTEAILDQAPCMPHLLLHCPRSQGKYSTFTESICYKRHERLFHIIRVNIIAIDKKANNSSRWHTCPGSLGDNIYCYNAQGAKVSPALAIFGATFTEVNAVNYASVNMPLFQSILNLTVWSPRSILK